MAVTAVILAGGQGRRMGGLNKALLSFGDETFIERQLQVAKEVSDEIIIVANDREISTLFQNESTVRVIPDIFIGEGPLAGLHAGLAAASNSVIWLLGCDQPFLNAAAAQLLHNRMVDGGNFQAALPLIGGRPQPLHAVYRKEVGDIVESLLISGERRFIALLDHIVWYGTEEQEFLENGISLRFADDIDTPEQYDQLRLKEQLP
jgi:molybdopterin-guanine dinucleotide biosynthesis protein A